MCFVFDVLCWWIVFENGSVTLLGLVFGAWVTYWLNGSTFGTTSRRYHPLSLLTRRLMCGVLVWCRHLGYVHRFDGGARVCEL
jgi:hypothetical protein